MALLWAPAANAATAVFPGVTYAHVLRYTPHGTASLYIVRGPRPVGRYSLQPVLSNGAIVGRETVSSIERDVSAQVTSIGVNGDFFNWGGGWPTGILMRNGALDHQPHPRRSSLGIDATGTLHVDRVSLDSTWQGTGIAHPLNELNDPVAANHVGLYTPAWGTTTPSAGEDAVAAVLANVPPAVPGAQISGAVTMIGDGSPTQIPPGGAVLVGRGRAAPTVFSEAAEGTRVRIGLALSPWTSGMVGALGGGPLLVRNGRSTVDTSEALTPVQLFGDDPRTAVGQRADGGIVLLVVDGRQRGSVGMTNAELAQELLRQGCVTGLALDSGGSSTIALDGRVLNHPSDSTGERPVAEALLLTYTGVYVPDPTAAVLSPNGDGVGERERLSYKVVRPSTVTATLVAPDGAEQQVFTGARPPGRYSFTWDGAGAAEGRWRWRVVAADDLGQTSAERTFQLDRTLGFVRAKADRKHVTVRLTLKRPADVRVTVAGRFGEALRRVHPGPLAAGRKRLRFSARDGRGRKLGGRYTLTVSETSAVGTARESVPLRVP